MRRITLLDAIVVILLSTLVIYGCMILIDKILTVPINTRDMIWVIIGASVAVFACVWKRKEKV